MTRTEPATIIGVFRERVLAEQAVDELRRVGLRSDQIRVIEHDSGSILTDLKNTFSGQDTTRDVSSDNLVGVPQEDIPYYQHELEAGYTIVVVQAYTHQQQARTLLHQYGAYNATDRPLEMGGSRTIPVRKEELQLHKEVAQTGEIRIHKRVITEEKTFTVPVTREELTIECVPHSDHREGRPIQTNDEQLVDRAATSCPCSI